jgi:hypothetical protein
MPKYTEAKKNDRMRMRDTDNGRSPLSWMRRVLGRNECLEELYSVSIEREGGKIYYLNEYNEVIHTRSSDEEAER